MVRLESERQAIRMSKPFWVYILRCSDGSYYTGHTDELELRLGKHQSGELEGYTATRRPIELAYAQECARARKR